MYNEIKEFGLKVDATDYEADVEEVNKEFGISLVDEIKEKYDGILLAESYDKFSEINIESLKKDSKNVIFDFKEVLSR